MMIKAIGWSCIAGGSLANPLFLGWILSADGRIESALFNGLIVAADAVAIGAGVYLVRNPRRAALGNVGLLGLSLLLAFMLAEAGARLLLFGWAAFSPRMMASVSDARLRDLVRAVDDANIGYGLKPNLDVMFKLEPLRTNEDGWHDEAYPKTKAPGVFRIAVLGDSFTMPAGVALEDAWHSRIEDGLNVGAKDARFEVMNFGVAGYDLRQYVAVLESYANAYDPDLILIGFCAENDHQVGADPADMLGGTTERRWFPRSYVFQLLSQLNYASYTEMSKRPTANELDYVAAQFGELAEAAEAPVIIAYLANLRRDGAEEIGVLAEAAGFGFVDASAAFAGEPLAPFAIYHPIDSHPNAAANAIFAEEILAYLEARSGD